MIKLPSVKVKGFIQPQVLKDGKVVRERPFSPNMITTNGLNKLAGDDTWVSSGSYSFAGTANTAPALGDVSLGSQLGKHVRTDYSETVVGSPDYYVEGTATYTYGVGDIVGNVAEIGFSTTNSDTDLDVRELVRDGGGNPTTISVAADEQLRIVYKFRKYIPQGDFSGTTPEGVSWTARALRATVAASWAPQKGFELPSSQGDVVAYDGSLDSIESSAPTGSTVGTAASDVLSTQAYVTGSFENVISGTVGGTECVGTFSAMKVMGNLAGCGCWQLEFGANEEKASNEKIDIELTIGWAEATI